MLSKILSSRDISGDTSEGMTTATMVVVEKKLAVIEERDVAHVMKKIRKDPSLKHSPNREYRKASARGD